MTPEEAIQYFNDEIWLCRAAPSINGCQMTEDWQRTIDACEIAVAAIRKVHELEQAEQDGRLVVLPCKVGDTVYVTGECRIMECFIDEAYLDDRKGIEYLVSFDCDNNCEGCPFNDWHQEYSGEYSCNGEWGQASIKGSDIGKTVFLTREDAEAALKGDNGHAQRKRRADL